MNANIDVEIIEMRAQLWGSFLLFCQVFYEEVTGRPFVISSPLGRESHFITISRELTLASKLEVLHLIINVPPGSGKSTLVALWVAWTMSRYPDSQYLYVSYGFDLAAKHTEFIRRVIQCPLYQKVFGIYIRHDMKAKDHFVTNFGGSIKAFGMSGPIVGQDGGLPNCDRFSGAIIMDDLHKPDEAHSEVIRQGVIQNYQETLTQRPRSPLVPMIFIGQRLHERDLPAFLLSGEDEYTWKPIVLKALDDAGNALYPQVNPLDQLLQKKAKNKYVFSSQYQQEPVPAGDALYQEANFAVLDEEPDFLCTFITVDSAETAKTYNDATALGFWGLYKLTEFEQEIEMYGLHNINTWEVRVEPKDLEDTFNQFYSQCMLHKTKPMVAGIEKKSTGVWLCSILDKKRGLKIIDIDRTRASGSKADRYIEMQPVIAAKLISLTYGARHNKLFVDHMVKITANDSHAHDDIADMTYDAVKMALIDKSLHYLGVTPEEEEARAARLTGNIGARIAAVKNNR